MISHYAHRHGFDAPAFATPIFFAASRHSFAAVSISPFSCRDWFAAASMARCSAIILPPLCFRHFISSPRPLRPYATRCFTPPFPDADYAASQPRRWRRRFALPPLFLSCRAPPARLHRRLMPMPPFAARYFEALLFFAAGFHYFEPFFIRFRRAAIVHSPP